MTDLKSENDESNKKASTQTHTVSKSSSKYICYYKKFNLIDFFHMFYNYSKYRF